MSRLIVVEGWLPIFFLLVVLKIPVFGALWLVWWASRPPQADGAAEEGTDDGFRRWRPQPLHPRGPRRGPGGGLRKHRRARRAGSVPEGTAGMPLDALQASCSARAPRRASRR